jgi:hypothetical protein
MLKLPPPIWALFYLIVAGAISYVAGWPWVPGPGHDLRDSELGAHPIRGR